MTQNKMVVTCQKCERVWESEFQPIDASACPVCGVHGKITLANSKPLIIRNRIVGYIPAYSRKIPYRVFRVDNDQEVV